MDFEKLIPVEFRPLFYVASSAVLLGLVLFLFQGKVSGFIYVTF